jgi:hypothetical protein
MAKGLSPPTPPPKGSNSSLWKIYYECYKLYIQAATHKNPGPAPKRNTKVVPKLNRSYNKEPPTFNSAGPKTQASIYTGLNKIRFGRPTDLIPRSVRRQPLVASKDPPTNRERFYSPTVATPVRGVLSVVTQEPTATASSTAQRVSDERDRLPNFQHPNTILVLTSPRQVLGETGSCRHGRIYPCPVCDTGKYTRRYLNKAAGIDPHLSQFFPTGEDFKIIT